jgi:serine/threonine protein phosphatase PrpC
LKLLIVVADGLGGHQAGEVASRMIVDRVVNYFSRTGDRTLGTELQADWQEDLVRVIHAANAEIYHAAAADPNFEGMGSTVVAGVIEGDRLHLANVGDSRAYLINQATIDQLSQDHSWVAEQVRAGAISASEARHHPWKNRLLRAVGTLPEVPVDTWTFELDPGDQVLLCTDGLSNLVTDWELAEVARAHQPRQAAEKLVELARQRGAPDNVTAVIAQFAGAG